MAIIEEGRAAKRSDALLDHISQMKAERDDLIASYEWRLTYGYIVIAELAKTATDEQIDILLDLCKVMHNGGDDER